MIDYIFHFFFGGTLFSLLYYFANIKKESINAILITIPLKFLISFIYIYLANASNKKFIYNAIYMKSIYLIFLLIMFLLINYLNELYVITIGLICWLILTIIAYNYFLVDSS